MYVYIYILCVYIYIYISYYIFIAISIYRRPFSWKVSGWPFGLVLREVLASTEGLEARFVVVCFIISRPAKTLAVVLFVGVLMIRTVLFGVYVRAADFWQLPLDLAQGRPLWRPSSSGVDAHLSRQYPKAQHSPTTQHNMVVRLKNFKT